jgi:hypothetical protein
MAGIGADEQRAQTLGVNTRLVKIGGFALTAAFAGAVGAAMSVRWTYIDPATVFNPFIGFQTVLIALIGGAATLWGPLLAAGGLQPAGRDAAPAAAAAVHDDAGPAADRLRALPARRPGVAALGVGQGLGRVDPGLVGGQALWWSGDKARDEQRLKEAAVHERPARCSKPAA